MRHGQNGFDEQFKPSSLQFLSSEQNFARWFAGILRPVRVLTGGLEINRAGGIVKIEVKLFTFQRAIAEPVAGAPMKFALHHRQFYQQLTVRIPVADKSRAVVKGETTQQPSGVIPLPAQAVPLTQMIAGFLGQLAVEMPAAIESVQLPANILDRFTNSTVPIIKPGCAKFLHGCRRRHRLCAEATTFLTPLI